jgi:AmmeMemoRadiSam system protein A
VTALTSVERTTLLALAREAVTARVHGHALPLEGEVAGRLGRPGAAFVSVRHARHLRGCLGCIEPAGPSLAATVVRLAAAAASDDPRFTPLTPDELLETTVEISVLGPLHQIAGPEQVEIGRHGLVVDRAGERGLLLPQVAVAWQWSAEQFVAETCRKAGLPLDAWRTDARLYCFEAEVFSDGPHGHA